MYVHRDALYVSLLGIGIEESNAGIGIRHRHPKF
jgi:hypothetical protein